VNPFHAPPKSYAWRKCRAMAKCQIFLALT
jgi:hypothetical protein